MLIPWLHNRYVCVSAAYLSNMFCYSSQVKLWTHFVLTQQEHVRLDQSCQKVYGAELHPFKFTTAKQKSSYPACPDGPSRPWAGVF